MTRFARKQGLAEKKENTRKAEDATGWTDMFSNSNTKDEELDKLQKHKEDYDNRIELENRNKAIKKTKKSSKSKLEYETLLEKYSETIDKEVI